MHTIKVGAASLNQTPLDWEGNIGRILQAINRAREAQVQVLCLPELAVTGYGCEDAFHAPYLARRALKQLERIVPATEKMVVCVGLPVTIRQGLYDAAALIYDGQVLGFTCKQFLAGDGVHYEPRWFKPWVKGSRAAVVFRDTVIPAGDLCYALGDLKIGIEICEDAWATDRPARDFASQGVSIVLNPSASHFAFGKLPIRHQIIQDGSRAGSLLYIYANLVGNEAGRIIYDGGNLIVNCGKLIAQGRRFTFREVDAVYAAVDLDAIALQRARNPHFPATSAAEHPHTVNAPPLPKPVKVSGATWESEPFENSRDLKFEEFTRAVGLGLLDYLRKSHSRGFVVSLSGGVDSGACALLVYYMVKQVQKELGMEGLRAFFEPLYPDLDEYTPERLMPRLLTCVYQSSEHSGTVTFQAARKLTGAINATFHHLDIQPMVQKYRSAVEQSLGRPLTWEQDDLALQNIQARSRGPSVWLFANVQGALLLTTSNRSEAAVGYATMDGDTCGGLCPIGGVDKNFLIHWMQWVQDTGPVDLGPVSAVEAITEQKPTAELRPREFHQTDEDDLMPYWLLAEIEVAAIRDRRSPREVFESLHETVCRRIDKESFAAAIRRFFTLWQRNQWKRERYAPSFHLDDENLDPKTWCRYPILSGDFSVEFAELDKALQESE